MSALCPSIYKNTEANFYLGCEPAKPMKNGHCLLCNMTYAVISYGGTNYDEIIELDEDDEFASVAVYSPDGDPHYTDFIKLPSRATIGTPSTPSAASGGM